MNSSTTVLGSSSLKISRQRRRFGRLQTVQLFIIVFSLAVIALIAGMTAGEHDAFLRQRSVGVGLCIATGLLFLLPSIYLRLQRRFDFFHPLVYPVFTYLFPSLIVGGLFLLSGRSTTWVMDLVSDPDYYISLSFIYILIGFVGLIIGFALPLGRLIGRAMSRYIPNWTWSGKEAIAPALFLLFIGVAITFWAITLGVGGYQNRETIELEGGLAHALTVISGLGSFTLWWCYFRQSKKSLLMHMMILVSFAQIFLNSMISGSRATVLTAVIGIFAAYRFSGRRVGPRTIAAFALLGIVAIIIGFSMGTTYRTIKGSESSVTAGGSLEYGFQSLESLSQQDFGSSVFGAADVFIRRLEIVSSFSVIVANYERLAPLEAQYGIKNSIWTSFWTAFIPRFLWPDKPLISNARGVAALYFNFPSNSFGTMVFGDLLRNFGPFGVPLGMMVLGIILRVLYVALLEKGSASVWRTASYFLLLSSINYESFYGSIFPAQMRIGFGLLLGGALVQILVANKRRVRLGFVLKGFNE